MLNCENKVNKDAVRLGTHLSLPTSSVKETLNVIIALIKKANKRSEVYIITNVQNWSRDLL